MAATLPDLGDLRFTPTKLQAAVQALPPVKGKVPPNRGDIASLRARLLELSVDQLANFKLRRRAIDALPYLAVETDNQALQDRILALVVRQVGDLPWSTVSRMLPYLYTAPAFRDAVIEKARTDRAGGTLPRWLRRYGERALKSPQPAAMLAHEVVRRGRALVHLLPHLQLRAGTPLAAEVLAEVLRRADDHWLDNQPYTATLRWIEHSGAPLDVRRQLLHRIALRYLRTEPTSEQLADGQPLGELMGVAERVLGGGPTDRPDTWAGMPPVAVRAQGTRERLQELEAAFPSIGGASDPRLRVWRKWAHRIYLIERDKTQVGLHVGGVVFRETERLGAPVWMFTAADWLRRKQQPHTRVEPSAQIARMAGWQDQLDAFIASACGVGPGAGAAQAEVEIEEEDSDVITPVAVMVEWDDEL